MRESLTRILATSFLFLLTGEAAALDWQRLWWNDDQLAAERMRAGDHAAAARTFDDRRWQAAAWYRAGEYRRAAEALEGLDDIQAHYNRGNALAKSGDLDGAIAAYETVLEREPGHADARHNLEVIRHLVQGGSSESGESREEEERQEGDERTDGSSAGGSDRPPEPRTIRQPDASPDEGDSRADSRGTGDGGRSRQQTRTGEAGDPDAGRRGDQEAMQALPEAAAGAPDDTADPEQQAERRAAMDQWLRRVPDDPGGLLRRKFRYQYSRRGRDDPPGGESW